ncbi:MAG: hypothetical protein EXR79_00220 [Myxococcales bacterium]|nr:hypothetical protein [Myxococcales bacterium]
MTRSDCVRASLLLALAACGSTVNQTKALSEAVTDYANCMRWGRVEQAALHVPDAQRATFIRVRRAALAGMQVHDFEVRGVDHAAGAGKARVIVAAAWSRPTDPSIRQEVLEQLWRWEEDHWVLFHSQPAERADATPKPEEAF